VGEPKWPKTKIILVLTLMALVATAAISGCSRDTGTGEGNTMWGSEVGEHGNVGGGIDGSEVGESGNGRGEAGEGGFRLRLTTAQAAALCLRSETEIHC